MTILSFNKSKPAIELSNKQLIALAPSIGASRPACHVSDKYSFISSTKAINYLRDSGWIPIAARESRSYTETKMGFQRHLVKFTKPGLDLGNKRIEMNMYNSHDSESCYILSGVLFRLICSNGLVPGQIKLNLNIVIWVLMPIFLLNQQNL